ncbi:MAG TPA: hypothetical protein PK743_02075 [Luteimonas sp.]|nr:hypothetical protein [Luteimonas sp.]
MSIDDQELMRRVREAVPADRLSGAIVYGGVSPLEAGARFAAGDVDLIAPWPALVVFVDPHPQANWGHDCLYLLMRRDGREHLQAPASLPPFLKQDQPRFRLLWKAATVPDWAIANGADRGSPPEN